MSQAYDSLVQRESQYYMPTVRRWPLALVRGDGSKVWDIDGNEFVDLTAGWGVTVIGHCHPAIVEAISDQARTLIQTTNVVYSEPQLDLAERLAKLTPAALQRSFFVSSGAEANEGALKLAHRKTGRSRYVATNNSFHGRTLGAMGCLGQAKYRGPWSGIVREQTFVPYGDLAAMERAISDDVAAVIVEPVQGEGGVNVPSPDYLPGVKAACERAGALLIADEIQTGIGRTGRFIACQHTGVTPDILTLGKGIGGGVPLAAFMATDAVMESVVAGDHGGTYAGNLLTCRVGAAVLRVVEEEGLVERSASLGEHVRKRLEAMADEHSEKLEAARGLGLLCGLVIRDPAVAAELHPLTRDRGVLVNLTAERVLRLFPALNIPQDELDHALDVIESVIDEI